jgi:hypothetical protein
LFLGETAAQVGAVGRISRQIEAAFVHARFHQQSAGHACTAAGRSNPSLLWVKDHPADESVAPVGRRGLVSMLRPDGFDPQGPW